MIEATHLTRRYGPLMAVDNVSFQIGRGEIVGLLGHNGAGKSTIMKMLTGYLEPNSGTIRIAGEELQQNRSRAQARIGYLPENCPLYPEMRVIDFLDYSASLRGLRGPERATALRRCLAQTELLDKALDTIATLSRGYRQRVGVAQALLHQPEILILDEPTNGLDPGQIEHMRELIRQLGQHATVIVSTHILQEVEAVCDRVLILRQGKLALDATLTELTRGQGLLLSCDMPVTQATEQLGRLAGVAAVELRQSEGGLFHYRLRISSQQPQLAADIARAVVNANGQLFALRPEERSLERVFHELSHQEVPAHAV